MTRSRRAAAGATLAALFTLLSLLIAFPGLAAGHPSRAIKRSHGIPSCSHFSATTLAKVLGTGPLKFKGRTPHSNLCTWEGSKPGHYHQTLSIDVIPGIKSIYETAESDGRENAAKEGRTFGTIPSRHNPWKAAFFVTGTVSNSGLEPCPPEHALPVFGPPGCSGDPEWTTINVDAYDSKLMVSAGTGAQHGDVQLGHVIQLDRDILSGVIR